MVLAVLIPALAASGSSGPTVAAPAVLPATNPTSQWAFGGSFSSSFSCSTTGCPGGNTTTAPTLSMSWNINLNWAVIYSRTNVSGTQTEFGVQAALGGSASFSYSACTTSEPVCNASSASVSISGHESKSGYTNVTSTGSVNLTAGAGSPATVAALAIMNAASHEVFNVSGSLSVNEAGKTGITLSGSFDAGGSEQSAISFPTPLGVIPTSVAPGDNWTAKEPYTASGSYKGGASISATVNGTSYSINKWAPGSIARTGNLSVNGSDLGTATLTDKAKSPPTTVTVQEILLTFSEGNFTASDGWVLASTAVYNGTLTNLGLYAPLVTPAATLGGIGGALSNESTYYTPGQGFVGAAVVGATTSLGLGLPGGPKLNLQAGPETVSAAQNAYNSILAGPASAAFPWLLVAAVVVAVVVVVGLVLLVRARSARRRPPTPLAPAPAVTSPASPPTPPPQGGA